MHFRISSVKCRIFILNISVFMRLIMSFHKIGDVENQADSNLLNYLESLPSGNCGPYVYISLIETYINAVGVKLTKKVAKTTILKIIWSADA